MDKRSGSPLSDEELTRQYQATRNAACLKAIFEKYYKELRGPFFKKWSGLKADDRSDLYGETWKEFLRNDILSKWSLPGYNVKNWIYRNILEWLPKKTALYKQLTESPLQYMSEESALERVSGDRGMNTKIEEYKELEVEAMEYVKSVLQEAGEPILTDKQKSVLQLLWMNYSAKAEAKDEKELAADLGLSKDVFSHRKDRAVSALIEQTITAKKPHIILFFHLFFGYDFEKLKAKWDELQGRE